MSAVQDLEIRLLLDAIYGRFQYDFRQYSPASVKRRVNQALIDREERMIELKAEIARLRKA